MSELSNPTEETARAQVSRLIAKGLLNMSDSDTLDLIPWPSGWKPPADRWKGCILGLAVGDSLGNTTESMIPSQRESRRGEIRDYLPNYHAQGAAIGLPSDDTQLCAWAIEHILEHGGFNPQGYQDLISSRQIYGIGGTVSAMLRRRREAADWLDAAQDSAGNGALMRCPGILAAHFGGDGDALAADAALFAATTHNNSAAISSAVAFTLMLAELMGMQEPPAPEWWPERYVALARPLEGDLP
jgi:ADP-ribosyl-[dinitrogen reductase] hydrolase